MPLPRSMLQLKIHFVEHAQARGADGVTEAFQPTIGLTRDPPVKVKKAIHHVSDCAASRGNNRSS